MGDIALSRIAAAAAVVASRRLWLKVVDLTFGLANEWTKRGAERRIGREEDRASRKSGWRLIRAASLIDAKRVCKQSI